MPPRIAALLFGLVFIACDGGNTTTEETKAAADREAAAKEAADKDTAAKEAADAAAKREETRKADEATALRAYDAAKGALEPLAKLPKKHPKGFAAACVEMLEQYDAFHKSGLAGDELAAWTAGQEDRERRMRRDCHNRPVEVVVCETAVLAKAPAGTQFEHIMRVCSETFDQPG
jgi:hypothetical protein